MHKKLLLLDLNETLCTRIHLSSSELPITPIFSNQQKTKTRNCIVYKRPYLDEFLEYCFANFNVAIFTSMIRSNALELINTLMDNKKLHMIITRDDIGDDTNSKNLEMVCKIHEKRYKYKPSGILIIDNSIEKLRNTPSDSYIIISAYRPYNDDDVELLALIDKLEIWKNV